MIAEELAPFIVPVDSIRLDEENARAHPPRNLAAIRSSLERFGQRAPVVCRADGTVIAGNGTLMAARALGWSEIAAVTFFAGEVDEAGLLARAYAVADNRSGELAEWDTEALGLTLQALDGLVCWSDLGFQEAEVERLVRRVTPSGERLEGEEPEGSETPGDWFRCPRCAHAWKGDPRP